MHVRASSWSAHRRPIRIVIVTVLSVAAFGAPFRLMEATIQETQVALVAGTGTSGDATGTSVARIDAHDAPGPSMNGLIALNEGVLDDPRGLARGITTISSLGTQTLNPYDLRGNLSGLFHPPLLKRLLASGG